MNAYKIVDTGINNPDVSIAMLAYNHEKYIGQAIESILAQKTSYTYKIIIAEDFSTDGTRAIITDYQNRYPDKFKLILQNKNVGPQFNNFDLLSQIEGRYVAVLEGDDYWTDPLKLQKQIDFLEGNLAYVGCAGNARININDELEELIYTNEPKEFDVTLQDEIVGNRIITLTVCYRNLLINDELFFCKFKELLIGDWIRWCILCKFGKFRIINEEFGVYRMHSGGIYGGKSRINRIRMEIRTRLIIHQKFGALSNGESRRRLLNNYYTLFINLFDNADENKVLLAGIRHYRLLSDISNFKKLIKWFLIPEFLNVFKVIMPPRYLKRILKVS